MRARRHPALVDPDRIAIISERFASAQLREVVGYEPDWPVMSARRRAETEALIGAGEPTPEPGPQAGEHAGAGVGQSGGEHMDMRGLGDGASC